MSSLPGTTSFSPFSQRADKWQLRTVTLRLPRRPLLMGIVNVTPDSFSDGGSWLRREDAVDHALALAEQGADILDFGGESTRPYAAPVETEQELKRVVPVIEEVARQTKVPISIDTSKSIVAAEAIRCGAQIINDVTGLEGDPEMIPLAVESGAAVCAMHMQGSPQTMQDDPQYESIVEDIFLYLQKRRDALLAAGIAQEKICLDPGIGFGKTHAHNLQLIRHCLRFHALGCPLLVGHSRKGFIAHLLQDKQRERTSGTIGVSLALAQQGIQILRVHDLRQVRDALLLFEACGALQDIPE